MHSRYSQDEDFQMILSIGTGCWLYFFAANAAIQLYALKLTKDCDRMNHTVFTVFVLPFLLGIIIRLMFLKWKRGYCLSGVFALLSVIIWLWTKHLTKHGVDGTVLLWALMAIELTVGSIIVGGLSLLIRKAKH